MTTIDSFLFFQEYEILRLRLEILKDRIDYFVLTESSMTFSGRTKPMYFADNKHLFDDFKDKIIYNPVYDTPDTNVSWDRERWQRNAIIRGLEKVCKNENDIVFSGDLDEIPDVSDLFEYYENGNIYHPLMKMYYYYLNSYRENNWYGTKITNWNITKQLGVDPLRNVRDGYGVQDCGWHFSYCSGPEAVLAKMNAFSDIELNADYYRNNVATNIANNKDIFFRGQTMKIVPIDDSFPPYIVSHEQELTAKGLIKEYK
jgi:beta-1,4-mannosyl-glycoprotein beta-1,4-N-acetylglucosaminyltransferase